MQSIIAFFFKLCYKIVAMSVSDQKRARYPEFPPGDSGSPENGKITVFEYDERSIEEKRGLAVEGSTIKDKRTVTWINLEGVHDPAAIEKLGLSFALHPLSVEDILNPDQRPKMEDFGDYILVILKMIICPVKGGDLKAEQVSLVFGPNFVISFKNFGDNVLEPLKDRLRKGGRIRKLGADYLAYALLDSVVDSYFSILDEIGERIEDTDQQLVLDPSPQTLHRIQRLKNQMIFLRKSIWPLRELINGLERSESPLIRQSTRAYLRDVYDHTIQIIDSVESYRDTISGMLDIHLSSISNRLNEVMKVLTIFATIFIPLTFITGLYGMNFQYMPELGWHWGYFTVLGFMVLVGITLVAYFKKKRWF